MEPNKCVREILKELYQIDPGLKKKEEEIINTINVLLSSKPKAALREELRSQLRKKLLSRFDSFRKPITGRILEKLNRRVMVQWIGAAAMVMVVGITLFINRNSLLMRSNVAVREFDSVPAAATSRNKNEMNRAKKSPITEEKKAKKDAGAGLRDSEDEIKMNSHALHAEETESIQAESPPVLLEPSIKAALADDRAEFKPYEKSLDLSAGMSADKSRQKESRLATVYETPFRKTGSTSYSVIETLKDMNYYEKLKKRIESGQSPNPGFVPISDLVQNFRYSYPRPAAKSDFSITSEVGICPWNPTNRLLLIGIQAGDLSGPVDNASIRVMFNNKSVRSYRYINSDEILQVNDQETADAKQIIGPGNQMTLLYEIHLSPDIGKNLGEVAVIYEFRSGLKSHQNAGLPVSPIRSVEESSDTFKFAAAVAEWGLIINDSRYQAGADYGRVIRLAESASGTSADSAERKKFIDLVKKTRDLAR